MKRLRRNKRSKRAITLVELIVAIALTAVFAATCVMIILPVTKIYTFVKDRSRAQLVADAVVDAIRSECSKANISSGGDVWIASSTNSYGLVSFDSLSSSGEGDVLVFRRSNDYCETIASDYEITGTGEGTMYAGVASAESADANATPILSGEGARSRAIYWLFDEGVDRASNNEGYLHFGYFTNGAAQSGDLTYVVPQGYYDYTNALSVSAYNAINDGYTIGLNFHDLDDSAVPSYVICDVSIYPTVGDTETAIYTRTVALCF